MSIIEVIVLMHKGNGKAFVEYKGRKGLLLSAQYCPYEQDNNRIVVKYNYDGRIGMGPAPTYELYVENKHEWAELKFTSN